MGGVLDRVARKLAIVAGTRIHQARDGVAAITMPRFATAAVGVVISLPREIRHPERIVMGNHVKLGPNSVLKLNTTYPGGWLAHPDGAHVTQEFDPVLEIGDRVTATDGLHVTVFERVVFEDDVMFAGNVFVADGTHSSARGDRPYKFQGIDRIAPVRIGRGAWIGQNVVIMPGVTIGAHSLIGANSVVLGDVPNGCIAVGAPARVVSRWDADASDWVSVVAEDGVVKGW